MTKGCRKVVVALFARKPSGASVAFCRKPLGVGWGLQSLTDDWRFAGLTGTGVARRKRRKSSRRRLGPEGIPKIPSGFLRNVPEQLTLLPLSPREVRYRYTGRDGAIQSGMFSKT